MERDRHLDTDCRAFATAITAQIAIWARLPTVWDLHADVLGWPSWHSLIHRTQADQPLTSGQQFRWQYQDIDVICFVAKLDERLSMVWCLSGCVTAELIWTFASAGHKTEVRVELSPDVALTAEHRAGLEAALHSWLRDMRRAAKPAEITLANPEPGAAKAPREDAAHADEQM